MSKGEKMVEMRSERQMGPDDTGPYSPCKDLGLCSEMGLMEGSKQRDRI